MSSIYIIDNHLCKLITIDNLYLFIKYYYIINGPDIINVSSVLTTNKVYYMIGISLHEKTRLSLDLAKVSPHIHERPNGHHLCSCLPLDVSTIDYLGKQG